MPFYGNETRREVDGVKKSQAETETGAEGSARDILAPSAFIDYYRVMFGRQRTHGFGDARTGNKFSRLTGR